MFDSNEGSSIFDFGAGTSPFDSSSDSKSSSNQFNFSGNNTTSIFDSPKKSSSETSIYTPQYSMTEKSLSFDSIMSDPGMGRQDKYQPNKTASIYDSRNDTKESNNFGTTKLTELNMRERNEGNLSIIDRMRGVEGKRLDNSGEISLSDQYNDKSLDKRTFGGTYNITLTDIYKDKRLYNEVMGFNTDGFVKNEEEGTISQFEGKKVNKKEEVKLDTSSMDLMGMPTTSTSESEDCEKSVCAKGKGAIGGNAGIHDTKFAKEKDRKKEKDKKKEIAKKSKAIGVDKNGLVDLSLITKQVKVITGGKTDTVKRVMLNEELYIKAKEINLKYGKTLITTKELEEIDRGGKIPYLLMSYSELKKEYKILFDKNKYETKESQISLNNLELKKIKKIMSKKAIEGI